MNAQTMPSPIEYAQAKGQTWVQVTVLKQADAKGRTYKLVHKSAGYTCAGSMARWDTERYAVNFTVDGCLNGRSFVATPEGLAEAERIFSLWTNPE